MGQSRRAKKATGSAPVSSGDEQMRRKGKSGKQLAKKALRRWDADGMADEADGVTLDYSANPQNGVSQDDNSAGLPGMESTSAESSGTRTSKGQYVLKDLDNEVHSILGANEKKSQSTVSAAGVVESSLGAISGLFRNVIGGKVLTKADLDKPMKGMEEHLLKKNVAREAAVRLCEGVERELIGVKTGSFESISSFINLYLHTTNNRRRGSNHPYSNGIISPKNPHSNNLPRHPSLHLYHHLAIHPQPPFRFSSALRNFHRGGQRSRQIY